MIHQSPLCSLSITTRVIWLLILTASLEILQVTKSTPIKNQSNSTINLTKDHKIHINLEAIRLTNQSLFLLEWRLIITHDNSCFSSPRQEHESTKESDLLIQAHLQNNTKTVLLRTISIPFIMSRCQTERLSGRFSSASDATSELLSLSTVSLSDGQVNYASVEICGSKSSHFRPKSMETVDGDDSFIQHHRALLSLNNLPRTMAETLGYVADSEKRVTIMSVGKDQVRSALAFLCMLKTMDNPPKNYMFVVYDQKVYYQLKKITPNVYIDTFHSDIDGNQPNKREMTTQEQRILHLSWLSQTALHALDLGYHVMLSGSHSVWVSNPWNVITGENDIVLDLHKKEDPNLWPSILYLSSSNIVIVLWREIVKKLMMIEHHIHETKLSERKLRDWSKRGNDAIKKGILLQHSANPASYSILPEDLFLDSIKDNTPECHLIIALANTKKPIFIGKDENTRNFFKRMCIDAIPLPCSELLGAKTLPQRKSRVPRHRHLIKLQDNQGEDESQPRYSSLQNQSNLVLRLILFVDGDIYNLKQLLAAICSADFLGDTVHLDIHIQGLKYPSLYEQVHGILSKVEWKHGQKMIFQRSFPVKQVEKWIESWRPQSKNEYALFLDANMDLSPVFYRWTKDAITYYHRNTTTKVPGIYGISLRRQRLIPGDAEKVIRVPKKHNVFAYQVVGSKGLLMFPDAWSEFRDWFSEKWNSDYAPSVSNIVHTEPIHQTKEDPWDPWLIRWAADSQRYCIYTNFPKNTCLAVSFAQEGGSWNEENRNNCHVAEEYDDSFASFTTTPRLYDCFGNLVSAEDFVGV